jgi:hypothetical protein
MAVFWVVAPSSLVEVYRRFGGACCLHHQGDRQTTRRNNPEDSHRHTYSRENLKPHRVELRSAKTWTVCKYNKWHGDWYNIHFIIILWATKSRDSCSSNYSSYWTTELDDQGSILGRAGLFSRHCVQTGSEVHTAVPVSLSLRSEADHSPASRVEDKKVWRYTSTPPYVFMTCV